ncbi:hypothetical protein EGT67_17280 [Prescottella agglutinans]|uniref:DUF1023 domain-containing protein n=1 Tax=Prescottella agglutinans TaxID=1644129 RepID=A0A438BAW1_9NOCA|nr:alpha/beta hydrolase [Prescottella agglutinans]RVW08163.1 hypothetical protein EGT67_17280 [Prescottella agglutinans]
MRPTVTVLRTWDARALDAAADTLSRATDELDAQTDLMVRGMDDALDTWHGDAARGAWDRADAERSAANRVAMALLETTSSMRRGAGIIESARAHALSVIDGALSEGFTVADDGSVTAPAPDPFATIMVGGNPVLAREVLDIRARELAGDVGRALDAVDAADRAAADSLNAVLAEFALAHRESTLGEQVRSIVDGRADLPDDPARLHEFWTGLSAEEKDALFAHDPTVGNRDGIPAVDKDRYNRMNLETLRTHAHAAVDAVDARHPDWARGDGLPERPPGNSRDEKAWKAWAEYNVWTGERDKAVAARDGYAAVGRAVDDSVTPPRYLLSVDDQGRAAVALGDPDRADNVATFVPGTGSRLTGIENDVDRSARMLGAAQRADQSATTSVVTWYGYNAPQTIPEAGFDRFAEAGAPRLDRFQDGLRAAHVGLAAHQVVVGHSYGSTVIGTAAVGGGSLDADDLVFVGSPGVNAEHVSDLHLDGVDAGEVGRRVHSTAATWDPVPYIGDVTLAGRHVHGLDPTDPDFGGQVFDSNPGEPGIVLGTNPEVHSQYWDINNPALEGMGRIIAGVGRP